MRIAYGTDDQTVVTDALRHRLVEQGHDVDGNGEPELWTDTGRHVGELVANGMCDKGIVWCWTGTGVAMAANKVPGVRAALCTDAETARGARRWNDANVLALSLRLTSQAVAEEIVEAFLTTDVDAEEAETIGNLGEQ
jgi:ribose 5-phosphate isomerase B